MQGGAPFAFTSPMLQGDDDRVLRECPTGYLLREAPFIYDLLDALSVSENARPGDVLPRYYIQAARLKGAELDRIREIKNDRTRGTNDSAYGAKVLQGK